MNTKPQVANSGPATPSPPTSKLIDWFPEGEAKVVDVEVDGVQMKKPQKRPTRRVQRLSPGFLLRQKLLLPGDITLSAERHNGRLMVRVEVPDG